MEKPQPAKSTLNAHSVGHTHRETSSVVLENVPVFENSECVFRLEVAILHEGLTFSALLEA